MNENTIKPSQIEKVLDLALLIGKSSKYVPLFSGDAGIGKSEITQQWAKKQGQDFGFVDIRLAYMEGPDLTGLPSVVTVNGVTTTVSALPNFLPKSGRGLILFEEPNRGHESTMNAIMQILTDRKIHEYTVPDGWIIAGCINPEGPYNVNTMDPALKNRFSIYDVKYNHNEFLTFAKSQKYDTKLVSFLESGIWQYKSVEEVSAAANFFYNSPRSFSKLNAVLTALKDIELSDFWFSAVSSCVGNVFASDYSKFIKEIRPILFEDILANKEDSFKKLRKMCDSSDYKGDLVNLTVQSVTDAFNANLCDMNLVKEVAMIIEADQAVNLISAAVEKIGKDKLAKGETLDENYFKNITQEHKDVIEHIKRRIKK